MRIWHKYFLDDSLKGNHYRRIDQTYDEHSQSMGCYEADESYCSKEEFFEKYYYNYHEGRLQNFTDFILDHLENNEKALSIASGRCAAELFLIEKGFNVTCSDLGVPPSLEKTGKLFPDLKFKEINILNDLPSGYDSVICLGLIYLFDREELQTFFDNVSNALPEKGKLIIDLPASSDNLLNYLIHNVMLKYETMLVRIVKYLITGKKSGFVKKHHGYFKSDRDMLRAAKKAGMTLVAKKEYAFLTEFKRSRILKRLIEKVSVFRIIFTWLGRKYVPYTRMYYFVKD